MRPTPSIRAWGLLALLALVAAPASAGSLAPGQVKKMNEILVGLDAAADVIAVGDQLAAESGGVVLEYAPLANALVLGVPKKVDPKGVIEVAARHPLVTCADFHYVTSGAASQVQRADGVWSVWSQDNHVMTTTPWGTSQAPAYESLQWNLRRMRVAEVFDQGIAGEHVVVAVLDTGVAYESWSDASGIYYQAPDLAHTPIVTPYDFINADAHANDDNGHGTQMTTLLAGFGATMGVAPNVTIMPVKVLDDQRLGTELALAEGIQWAVASGADIISMSLAFPDEYVPSLVVEQAVAVARDAGVLLVAATGNDGGTHTPYPAAFGDVIGVGAYRPDTLSDDLAETGARASYSNGSAAMDFLAPGGSHDHDVDGDGYPDATLSFAFAGGDWSTMGYYWTSGTSGAAAQASGVAALLLAAGENPEHVAARMRQTAYRDAGTPAFDEVRGAGLVRAAAAVDGALNAPFPAGCAEARVYANPTGVLLRPTSTDRQARFVVEITDEAFAPLVGVTVHARYRGATTQSVTAVTDASGRVQLDTEVVDLTAYPDGVHWALHVEGIELDQAGCGAAPWLERPTTLTRIDELSFQLLSNFGAGIAASSVVLVVDSAAAATLPGVDGSNYERTYLHRPYGTGMAESSLVALYDYTFMATSGRLDRSFVVLTHGTGMAESSIVLDESWIQPARVAAYTPRTLLTLNFIQGTGMAESSIVVDGMSYPWDTYVNQLTDSPAIVQMDHGSGYATSARIFDRTFLDSARLSYDSQESFLGHPDVDAEGVGMAESSLVFDLADGQDPMADYYVDGEPTGGLVGDVQLGDARLAGTALQVRWTTHEALGDLSADGGSSSYDGEGASEDDTPMDVKEVHITTKASGKQKVKTSVAVEHTSASTLTKTSNK